MQSKTKAIIIRSVKYSDSSLIVNAYTREFGSISFIARGIRKSKKNKKSAYFFPLNIIDLDFDFKENRNLHYFKEASISEPLFNIQSDIIKSTVSVFLAEFLYRIIQEEEKNPELFDFIELNIKYLNDSNESYHNIHLLFIISMAKYLGFMPNDSYNQNNRFFNLGQAEFQPNITPDGLFMEEDISEKFHHLLNLSFENIKYYKIKNSERKRLLKYILKYYEIHLPEMGKMESLEILETVFE